MKSVVLFLVLLSSIYANPMWYHSLQKTKPNTYIGYGSGVDEVHAKQEAFNDIASQISVSVSNTLKQSQKIEDGKYKNIEEYIASQNSKATLYDYALIKSEFDNGKYFVAVEYENIPSLDKFVRKIKLDNFNLDKSEKQNNYLKETNIAKKLEKSLNKKIDFNLLRKDAKWYVKYKNILQPLDKKDFSFFFASISNADLEINTNKKRDILYDGDKFFFKLKSKQQGYVSIFSVYEDGTVSTLVRNIPIEQNRLENIPDEDFESIPEAGLMKQGEETFDLYVAIFSSKKMRFDSFAYADEELISEEKYKNFDELINFIDDKTYTTLKVVTKPKN